MKLETQFLTLPDRRIAYQQYSATGGTKALPGVIFLGGFESDMFGTKASFLADWGIRENISFTRFDYRGHGLSSDTFENGTIGDWADDALQVLDRVTKGPQILVGSSMGGWIGLLLARGRAERLAGFVGVAAAPDFTEDLILPVLSDRQKEELAELGKTWETEDKQGYPVTQKLLDEAVDQLVLRTPLAFPFPVHLIQGQQDRDVPWHHALKIVRHIAAPKIDLTLIGDGDHRLNRPQDLAVMTNALVRMISVTG